MYSGIFFSLKKEGYSDTLQHGCDVRVMLHYTVISSSVMSLKTWYQVSVSISSQKDKYCVIPLVASLLSRVWLFCDPMDYNLPGFSVHGIHQARILEWVAISFSRGSSWSRDEPVSPASQADSLPLSHLGSPWFHSRVCAVSLQSCPTVHQAPLSMGILQTEILEWVVMPFSRGSSQPRDRTCLLCLLYWQAGS